jgi:hypothetical protein
VVLFLKRFHLAGTYSENCGPLTERGIVQGLESASRVYEVYGVDERACEGLKSVMRKVCVKVCRYIQGV